MDIDDFETFSEDSLFGYNMDEEMYRPLHDYRDKSPGAVLLEAASLNYILTVLESHMRSVDKPDGAIGKSDIQNDMVVANLEGIGSLIPYIWMNILDPVAYRTHVLRMDAEQKLDNTMTRSKYQSCHHELEADEIAFY